MGSSHGAKGTGGLVAAGGSTLHSWMAKQIAVKNKDDHIDPRERILRHAEESKNNPYWISPAYKKTQPVPIFRETDPDEPAEKRSKTVANLAGITGAGGYPAQKPERQKTNKSVRTTLTKTTTTAFDFLLSHSPNVPNFEK